MHRDSCECSKTELDMFAMPPTMITMQEAQWVEHHPISSLTSTAPIEFEIKGQTEDYIDLNNSYLYLKVKVQTKDGHDVGDNDRVAPVNNFMHALFNEVDLYLNNKLVSSSTDTYPYRAYLENLLTYGKEAKNTHLDACVVWKPDTRALSVGFEDRQIKIRERRSL